MREKGLAALAGNPIPRVAYTINGDMPVISTYISQMPLFDYNEPETEGWAFCDECDSVQPYYIHTEIEPACPPEQRKVTQHLCKTCNSHLFTAFSPED